MGLHYDLDVSRPRIGILVVAYNAVTTLASTLDRIPELAETGGKADGHRLRQPVSRFNILLSNRKA